MECQILTQVGTARPNFVEKTFAGGSKTTKFMIVLSLKFSAIRYCMLLTILLRLAGHNAMEWYVCVGLPDDCVVVHFYHQR